MQSCSSHGSGSGRSTSSAKRCAFPVGLSTLIYEQGKTRVHTPVLTFSVWARTQSECQLPDIVRTFTWGLLHDLLSGNVL